MKSVNGEKITATASLETDNKSLIDDNADGNRYIGEASRGTATSAAAWTITRIGSAAIIQFDHAPANSVWDDRTSLVYT